MIYDYLCIKCDLERAVSKSMHESSRPEPCDACGNVMQRIYSPPQLMKTGVYEPNYNPAFGKVFKNKREERYEIDKTGAVEVGNEKPEKIHKHFDSRLREKLSRRWEED